MRIANLENFPVVDDFEGSVYRYLGVYDASLGFRTYPFEVEIQEIKEESYELIVKPIEPQEGDRDLFYVNTLRSNALCYQLEQFLNLKLDQKIALTWGDARNQNYDRFLFAMEDAPK
jgi:hypothetical protein